MRAKLLAGLAAGALLAGCSTNVKLLEQRRDQLTGIEKSVSVTRDIAAQGAYDPSRYDLYLMLNSSIFDQLLAGFDNTKITIDGSRPIDVTLGSVRMAFRPGYPDLTITAKAQDRKSGAVAELVMDVRLLVEGDPNTPDTLYLRMVATRIVPRLKWGILNLGKWRFAQRLMALEATRLTEKIPRISIPVQSAFVIGGKARTEQVRIDTGDGYILGNVAYPATERAGRVVVRHLLFLKNGVHVFADVEGL